MQPCHARGLKAKEAHRQIAAFEEQCRRSKVLPLTDEIIVQAAQLYAGLDRSSRLVVILGQYMALLRPMLWARWDRKARPERRLARPAGPPAG